MAYELPELPYDYDALEPAIDERITELPHDVHHRGYVDGANEALKELEAMCETGEFEEVKRVKRDLSYNLSGHVNHSVFWENMSSAGGGEPGSDLAAAIDEDFGTVEAFRDEFTAAAEDVEGNGWAALVYDPVADRLLVAQVEGQNGLALADSTPLLMLDVWEHAYYLQYENERAAYVDAWWDVVDWNDVPDRLSAAESYWEP